VQELRKDLAHYSAQMGLVLAAGEAGATRAPRRPRQGRRR